LPNLNNNLTINGPGANLLTVQRSNAAPNFSVFIVTATNVSLAGLTISGGNATGGAGIFNSSTGTLNITGCSVSGNSSLSGGGGVTNTTTGTLNITGSTISGNTAAGNGGGIANATGTINIINSTISGNSAAGDAGGVDVNNAGVVNVTNSTITNNRADSDGNATGSGGGTSSGGGTLALRNSIVAGNFIGASPATTASDIANIGGTIDPASSFNLIGTGGSGGLTNGVNNNQVGVADPKLGPLVNNGGATQTHALLTGSPALDAATDVPLTTLNGAIADAVTMTVNVTDATTIPAGAPSTILVDTEQMIVLDKTGNALTVSRGANGTTAAAHATLTNVLPAFDQRGTAFPRRADSADAGSTQTVDIGAFEAHPTVENIGDQSMNEDGTLPINFNVGDDAIGIASVTATSSNTALVLSDNAHLVITGSGSTRTLTIHPNPNANSPANGGTSTITVTVTATNGQTATDTFVLTVNAVNDAPSFVKGADQVVNEDAGAQTVNGWATSISAGPVDEAGQTLTFNVSVTGTTGSLAFSSGPAIDATTGNLTYTTSADTNGTANVSVTLSDNGSNTPPSSNTSAPQTFTITVNAVNDPPSFTKGADPSINSNAGPQTVTNWATNISPGPNESGQTLTFNITPTGSTGTLTFATAPAINSTTGTLTYAANNGTDGTASFSVTLSDNGSNVPPNSNTSAPQTFTITVSAQNNPPVNTVPGAITIPQNTVLTFIGANQISVADVDAANPPSDGVITVTLTATNGTLNLSGTAGLSFNSGSNGSAAMSFDGTIPNINTALNGMTFTPTNNFTGSASVGILSNDQGKTGPGGVKTDDDTVSITVIPLTTMYINEVLFNPPGTDAPNEYIELRGTPSSVIPAGTYFVAIEGDAADNPGDVQTIINLSGLTFGSNGFLVLLQNGNTYTTAAGATVVTSTSTGFGGLPGGIWSADGGATDIEDSSASFMLIQTGTAPALTDDIDSNDDGLTNGSVFAGWSVRDSINVMNGSANARAYGAFGYRNVAGSGTSLGAEVIVNFIPSYVGRVCDSTGSTAADWVASGVLGGAAPNWTLGAAAETEPASFAGKSLNHIGASNFANLAPVNTVPGAQATNEDTPLVFTGATQISIADPDAGSAVVKVTLTAVNGTFSLSGIAGLSFTTGDGTNDTQMVFTGTIANINTALNNLTFTPPSNFFSPPDATLTILTEDQGNTGCGGNKTDSDTVNITVNAVNDPPSFTIAGNPPTVNEDAGAQTVNSFATSISQGPGESGQTLTFNVSASGTTGNLAFSSAPAINSSTGALTYTPSANTNGTATFNVTLSDNGSNVAPNSNTSGVQQFTITVNAVNDAPTFQIPSNPPTVNEDAGAQTVNSFATNFQPGPASATDEVGQTLVGYTVTQTGATGGLTFSSGPSISNAGQLTYTPSANASGTATFNVVATDSGSGIAPNVNQSAALSFTITVTGQNDAPVLDNSGNMTLTAINEDVPNASNPGTLVSDIILSAGGDRITDVDSGAVEGLAVIAVDNANGTWQFSIDNGLNWTAFGAPATLTSRLLASNATTRVRFIPNANFNGTIDPGITFRAWDQTSGVNGNTADTTTTGGTTAFSTATETAAITVISVNDNPTTTGLAAVNVNEDAPDTVINLAASFNDVEDGGTGLTYTIQGNTNPGLFSSTPINNTTHTLTLSYASNANGVAQITVRGTDTGSLFVESTFTVTVNPINDPPSFTKGADQTVNEDAGAQTVVGWATTISQGPGESGQTLTFNVSVFGTTGNLAFSSAPVVNPATGTLTYTPSANTNGTATINVTLSDNGSNVAPNSNTSAVQQFTITVNAVNDAPTFQIPSNPPSVNEDAGAQTVNSFATNFQPGPATATDEVGQTLVGYTLTPNGTTGGLTFTSGPSINNAGQLTYTTTANASGTATFNVVATDSGSGTAPNVNQSAAVSFTITVNAVNDAPMLDNSGNMTLTAINEDVPNASNPGTLVSDIILSAGGDRITDVDAGAVEGIAVTAVNNTNGTWQFSIDNGTNWTAFGSPDALNSRLLAADALTRVRFIPGSNFNGTVDPGLTFRAWDQTSGANGNTADTSVNGNTTAFSTATETASITVNPVNDSPTADSQSTSTNEDIAKAITLTGSDTETPSGSLAFVVTVLPAHGALSGTGSSRTYTPAANYNGPDSFRFTVTDTGDGSSAALTSAEATVSITVNSVNDAPSFTKGPDQTIQDPNPQSISNWATNISAGPADESGQTLTFLVSNNNNVLVSAQPAISPSGTLTFTAAAGQDGVATVTVRLQDNGGTALGGVDTSAPQTFTITVHALNNAPTLNALSNLIINEDASLQTVNLAGITPGPSFESAQTLTVTATSSNPALIPNPSVTYTNPNTTGSISFTPLPDANGSVLITVTLKDNGGTANGGIDTLVRTFTVTVNPVNDAPINHVPGAQTGVLNTSLVFSTATSNLIFVSDVDAGSDPVQVTLKATDGTLTLNSISGLSFSAGDGTDDALMTFTGSIANINLALNGMRNLTFGTGVIEITTNDLGHNGAGGALSDIDTVAVTVNDTQAPLLLTVEGTDRAIALDSVTLLRDPFTSLDDHNFSSDHRTRIALFALHSQLLTGETASALTAEAQDLGGNTFPLTVESVRTVPGFDWLTQVVVKLPAFMQGGGGSQDVKIRIRLHGQSSNQAVITFVPSP
jgi:hypothetical protein